MVKPATRGKRDSYHSGHPPTEYARGPNWPEIESRHSRAKATGIVAIMLAAALALLLVGVLVAAHVRHHSALEGSNVTVPLIGSSVSNQANLDQETSEFGHMPIVRVYYPGLPGANAWTTGMAAANNSAVVVSFKALPQTILSGPVTRRWNISSTRPLGTGPFTTPITTSPRTTSPRAIHPARLQGGVGAGRRACGCGPQSGSALDLDPHGVGSPGRFWA